MSCDYFQKYVTHLEKISIWFKEETLPKEMWASYFSVSEIL